MARFNDLIIHLLTRWVDYYFSSNSITSGSFVNGSVFTKSTHVAKWGLAWCASNPSLPWYCSWKWKVFASVTDSPQMYEIAKGSVVVVPNALAVITFSNSSLRSGFTYKLTLTQNTGSPTFIDMTLLLPLLLLLLFVSMRGEKPSVNEGKSIKGKRKRKSIDIDNMPVASRMCVEVMRRRSSKYKNVYLLAGLSTIYCNNIATFLLQ